MAQQQIREIISGIDKAHGEFIDTLLGLQDSQLDRPDSSRKGVTVRRRLIHAVDHIRMHIDQILKTRRQVRGYTFPEALPNEVQHYIIALEEAFGALKGMLLTLEDADLDRDPGDGRWGIRKIIDHLVESEKSYLGRIQDD